MIVTLTKVTKHIYKKKSHIVLYKNFAILQEELVGMETSTAKVMEQAQLH